MDSDGEPPWHVRLAREMNANREELREFLARNEIAPIDTEEFIASAILSVPPERWSASTKLFALLKQAMKEWLRSHRAWFFPPSQPGMQTRSEKQERVKTKRRGAG
jgi:hypothetical protein